MRCEIIYEDKEVLVIYKPAGLATQTARVGQPDAVSELKNYLAKGATAPYLGIIHRLDQPVEGLLVFAKNKMAAAALTAQLGQKESGIFNKQYRAVVCGKAEKKQDTLVDNLVKLPDGRAEIAASDNREAKRAVLRYECLAEQEAFRGNNHFPDGNFHRNRAVSSNQGADGKCGTSSSGRFKIRRRRGNSGIRTALCTLCGIVCLQACISAAGYRKRALL